KGMLFLTALQVQGSLSCTNEGAHRTEVSHVVLLMARISGPTLLRGAKIGGVLNLSQAEMEGLACDGPDTEIKGPIVLAALRAPQVPLDARATPAAPLHL